MPHAAHASRLATLPVFAACLLSAVAGGCSVAPSSDGDDPSANTSELTLQLPAETSTQRVEFGYLNQVFLPCAAGGAGEFVVLQGRFEGVVHSTIDGRGRFHIGVQMRPALVTGIGETTGDEYRLRGASHDQFSGVPPAEFTFTNEFRIIAPGPNNDGVTFLSPQYAVSPEGELSVTVGTQTGGECS